MKRVKHFILWLLNLFNLMVQITASLSYRQQSRLWVNISLQAPSTRPSVGIWSAKQCGNPTLQRVYTRLSYSLFPLSILIMRRSLCSDSSGTMLPPLPPPSSFCQTTLSEKDGLLTLTNEHANVYGPLFFLLPAFLRPIFSF